MNVPDFKQGKHRDRKLVMVTAYDALFAGIVEKAQVDAILVGDSLGMVVQGKPDTLSVTMEDMIYHTSMVARGVRDTLIVADMPFLSYQVAVEEAVRNAGRLLQAGADAVKIEGGQVVLDRVHAMTKFGIPVMGHLGMTPQSVRQFGGYRVQGREEAQVESLVVDARLLEEAGAFALVLEAIPTAVARRVTQAVGVPTVGIGAGPHCDGQILVLYDVLGLFDEFVPKFVKPYAHLKADALQALTRYIEEVQNEKYPSSQESYE